jgi:NAD(P)-dependent dehydrogenase (short-subunit alcohol dehydrogenase family)
VGGWGPFGVEGRRVVVTGTARGIGFGIAGRLVDGGADVPLVDVREDGGVQA